MMERKGSGFPKDESPNRGYVWLEREGLQEKKELHTWISASGWKQSIGI